MKTTILVLAVLAAILVTAQTPAAFEVASVRRAQGGNNPGDIPRNMDPAPGQFAMRNVPLRFAIEWAYDLKDFQVAGPEWIKIEERYDIIAKAPGRESDEQMRAMLQTLLTERFQMKTHREKKDMQVYVLLPGKGTPKVRPATPDVPPGLGGDAKGALFTSQPISRFTFMLTRRLGRPVFDETGLKGAYDFQVDLSGLGFNGNPPPDDTAGPSIFTAVQNDLGLKLESLKRPIDVLVIDSVSKVPTEN